MNEYNSKFTGTEIDAALSRAAAGGAIDTDLALKAPLASPALTGTPTINGVAAANVGQLCNPNLLDNWYFANPVDQRGGYVVPPGTAYYVPGTWDTADGTTTNYVKVDRFFTDGSGSFPIIIVNGADRVCNIGTAVRGYTGAGYSGDRWYMEDGTVSFANGYYEPLVKGPTIQKISEEKARQLVGKTLTISALTADGLLKSASGIVNPLDQDTIIEAWVDNNNYVTIHFFANSKSYQIARIYCKQNLLAVKAELGSQQTLAHQENGNWVLNEIPYYGEQLARCQRYFRRIKAKQVYNSDSLFAFPIVTVGGAIWANINVILSTMMRDAKPSVSFHGLSVRDYVSDQFRSSIADNAERNVMYYTGDTIKLSINTGITLTDTDTITMASDGYIDIINDL